MSKKENQKKSDGVSPIRTYRNDVADLVKENGLSKSKIALAEQRKKIQDGTYYDQFEEEKPKKRTWLKILLTILFILIGGAILFVTIQYGFKKDVTTTIREIISGEEFIKKESSIKIFLGNKTRNEVEDEIVREISDLENRDKDQIIEIEILEREKNEEGKEIETKISSTEFLRIIDANSTSRFNNSISRNFIFGIYTSDNPQPFLIFRTNEVDLSIAEAYKWEGFIYRDLEKIFNLKENTPTVEINNSTSTKSTATTTDEVATTTTQTSTTTMAVAQQKDFEQLFRTDKFDDIVIANRDVRVIRDENQEIIFMYSFIDNENILITKDRFTFEEIIRRISNKELIR